MTIELGSDLLLKLYATSKDVNAWHPLLEALTVNLKMRSACAQIIDLRGATPSNRWQMRDYFSQRQSAAHDRVLNNANNPRLQELENPRPWENVNCDARFFRDSPQRLLQLQRKLAQLELGSAIWVSFPIIPNVHFSLIFHRSPGDDRGLISPEEHFLKQLLPHLQQAVEIRRTQTAGRRDLRSYAAIFSDLRIGIIVCNPGLEVVWANDAALGVIHNSLEIEIKGGWLRGTTPRSARTLRSLERDAANEDSRPALAALGGTDSLAVHISASRLIGIDNWDLEGDDTDQFVLTFSQPQVHRLIDPQDLQVLYGLSPAEARLAAALGEGSSVAEFARSQGVTQGTARNQLKHVMSKTKTNRQSDLVRQLCNTAVSQLARFQQV